VLAIIMFCLSVGTVTMDGLKPETPHPECFSDMECPTFGCYQGFCKENFNCYLRPRCV